MNNVFVNLEHSDYNSCILGQNITKAGFQCKPCMFFLSFDLDFIDFFDRFRGIHGYFGSKNWKPWVVFMKPDKKQIQTSRALQWT